MRPAPLPEWAPTSDVAFLCDTSLGALRICWATAVDMGQKDMLG